MYAEEHPNRVVYHSCDVRRIFTELLPGSAKKYLEIGMERKGRARDEYLGAPAGQADPRNAAAAITAIREDAKLLRLAEFAEEARKEENDRLVIILDENGISSRKVESDEELAELRKELSPRDFSHYDFIDSRNEGTRDIRAGTGCSTSSCKDSQL